MFFPGSNSSCTPTHMSRWGDRRHGQMQHLPHGHHAHHGQHGQHGQQGRRTHTIVSTNLKTELCRNFEKGVCTYGDRCAFAHGREELKYRTLREMQNAGRIPDAVKYRCIPCMTWVATGSCPYSTRCVFIHDPRVQGRQEAWLYAGSHMSSAYHSSDSAFFFPDLPRDPDSLLPRDSSLYDLDPAMGNASDRADRSVYNMWYSFVSVLTNLEAGKGQTAGLSKLKLPTTRALSPSSVSSSNSTTSLSDRSASFGSSFSASSPRSISRSSSGSGSSVGGGGSTNNREPLATDYHQAAEHRLCSGGCPRLESLVSLGRGIPAAPPTPTSPGLPMEGFPSNKIPAVTSTRSHHVSTVPNRHSPRYDGGGGGGGSGRGGGSGGMRNALPSHYREASPQKQRPAAAAEYYHSAAGSGSGGVRKSLPSHYREASPQGQRPQPAAEYYHSAAGGGGSGMRNAVPSHYREVSPQKQRPAAAAEYYFSTTGNGIGGMRKSLPSHYREVSPQRQRPPAAAAEYHYSTSPPLRRAGDKPKIYGYERRESPREVTTRPVLLPAAEGCGRSQYHHHRHNMSPGRKSMVATTRSVTPHPRAAFEAHPEYARQTYYPEAESRSGSRPRRPETVRMLPLDLGSQGAPVLSHSARLPFLL